MVMVKRRVEESNCQFYFQLSKPKKQGLNDLCDTLLERSHQSYSV
jgi:hypothetical protein